MRRFTVLGFCLLTVTLVFTISGLTSASAGESEMVVPMGTLTLEPPSFVEPKRANVQFPHAKHFTEVSCQTCHHDWKANSPIKGCMTSGCHDSDMSWYKEALSEDNKEIKTDGVTAIHYYKKAYHGQCIGCHKVLREKSEKIENSMINLDGKIQFSGPTGCIECHLE